jgi:MFS family permease
VWWGAWAACLPAVRRGVGATNAELGVILLAVALAALPAMLLTGRLANRAGPHLVWLTLACFAAVGALPPLASSRWALFLFLLLVGAGSGALDVAINARASSLESMRGLRIMDGMHALYSAGVVVGGVGAGLLRRAGAHPTGILAGVCVATAIVAAVNARVERLPVMPTRHATLARPLLVIGAVFAISALLESGVEAWSALLLENGLHTSPAVSGLGPGLFAAGMVTGRALAQGVAPESAALRLALASALAASGLGLSAATDVAAVAVLGVFVAGCGLALPVPTVLRLAGRIGAAPAISTVAIIGYCGFLVGPPLIGAVAGATSLRGGFVFLACVGALLVTSVPILGRVRNDSPAQRGF